MCNLIYICNVEVARGEKRTPYSCQGCDATYMYRSNLREHMARSTKCHALLPAMPKELTFESVPPAPFGTVKFFKYCESLPLNGNFHVAQWDGPVDDQSSKLKNLLRQRIPLLWKNGAACCKGLSIPTSDLNYPSFVEYLLQPENLQHPEVELDVKSAKIGKVSTLSQCCLYIDRCCLMNFINLQTRKLSAKEFVRELREGNKPYEPLNVIDIQLKPKVVISFFILCILYYSHYIMCIIFIHIYFVYAFFIQLGPLSHAVNGEGGFYQPLYRFPGQSRRHGAILQVNRLLPVAFARWVPYDMAQGFFGHVRVLRGPQRHENLFPGGTD